MSLHKLGVASKEERHAAARVLRSARSRVHRRHKLFAKVAMTPYPASWQHRARDIWLDAEQLAISMADMKVGSGVSWGFMSLRFAKKARAVKLPAPIPTKDRRLPRDEDDIPTE